MVSCVLQIAAQTKWFKHILGLCKSSSGPPRMAYVFKMINGITINKRNKHVGEMAKKCTWKRVSGAAAFVQFPPSSCKQYKGSGVVCLPQVSLLAHTCVWRQADRWAIPALSTLLKGAKNKIKIRKGINKLQTSRPL